MFCIERTGRRREGVQSNHEPRELTSGASRFAKWPHSQSKLSLCLTLRLPASATQSPRTAFLSPITNIFLYIRRRSVPGAHGCSAPPPSQYYPTSIKVLTNQQNFLQDNNLLGFTSFGNILWWWVLMGWWGWGEEIIETWEIRIFSDKKTPIL